MLNTIEKIRYKRVQDPLCPLCLGKRDKLVNVLEKGSVVQNLKKESGEEPNEIIDVLKESEKMNSSYLNSDFYSTKSDIEKVCCFGCGRTFENAKDSAKFAESLPEIIKTNAQISIAISLAQKNSDEGLKNYVFYKDDSQDGNQI